MSRAADTGDAANPRRRIPGCLGWLLAGALALAVLALALHGPLLRFALREAALRLAAAQGVKLRFELAGNPLDRLVIRDLHATGSGNQALPSLDLRAREIVVDYRLGALITGGATPPVEELRASQLDLDLDLPAASGDPGSRDSAPERRPDTPPLDALRWIPERVRLDDCALDVRRAGEPLATARIARVALADSPGGVIDIPQLKIPGAAWLDTLHADAMLAAGRRLVVANAELGGTLTLSRLTLLFDGIARGTLGAAIEATEGDGSARLALGAAWRGERLELDGTLAVRRLALDPLLARLGIQLPLRLDALTLDAAFSGPPDPLRIALDVERLEAQVEGGPLARTSVALSGTLDQGRITIPDGLLACGENLAAIELNADLPGFPEPGPAGAQPPRASATVHLAARETAAWLQLDGLQSATAHGVAAIDLSADAREVRFSGLFGNVVYGDYTISELSLVLDGRHDPALAELPGGISGALRLTADGGLSGGGQPATAVLVVGRDTHGAGEALLDVAAGELGMTAAANHADGRLGLAGVRIGHAGRTLAWASGDLPLPLPLDDPRRARTAIAPDSPLELRIHSRALDLQELSALAGIDLPLTGVVNGDITLGGTLGQPRGTLELELAQLAEFNAVAIEPFRLQARSRLSGDGVAVSGRLEHPRIKPVTLDGRLGLNLVEAFEARRLPPDSPLDFRLQLERSPFEPLLPFAPAILSAQGELACELTIGGVLADPRVEGALTGEIRELIFVSPALPGIRDLQLALRADESGLTIERLDGLVAGGAVSLGGAVGLAADSAPTLDLALTADDALLLRNDDLLLRANAELRAVGALDSAALSGWIALTNSSFYKTLDFLPLNLPGSPPPPTRTAAPEITLAGTPIEDWTFRVALSTSDPFLVRGNLANGALHLVNGSLSGSGGQPLINGFVYSEDLVLDLPFSQLEVRQGHVTLRPDKPLDPLLDLHAATELRGRRIDVYLHGPLQDSEAILMSRPPLAREDILSLLASGVTRQEIEDNPSVLAGRATSLLARQILDWLWPNRKRRDTPLGERLSVRAGAGASDSEQGEVQASYQLSERFSLRGVIGEEGRYRAGVMFSVDFK